MKPQDYIYLSDFPDPESALKFFCRYGMEVEVKQFKLNEDGIEVEDGWKNIPFIDYELRVKLNAIRTKRLTHEDIIKKLGKDYYCHKGNTTIVYSAFGWEITWHKENKEHNIYFDDQDGYSISFTIPTPYDFDQILTYLNIKS